MTTYATTYGWRSTGVRRDLMTSPPKQNPVNGGRRGRAGVYGIADPITTNQKVAGSSPAERAISFLLFAGKTRTGPFSSPHDETILEQPPCHPLTSIPRAADDEDRFRTTHGRFPPRMLRLVGSA